MGDQAVQPAPQRGLVGMTIGYYEITRELGRGGMATVYLARQLNMNRQVAIKVLPREFLHDPQFIERFKREVALIAALEHPHILPVYDFGEYDRIPYIVMRYLAGGSFLDLITDRLPALTDLIQPVNQVCQALDFAHAEGIIHRDLKPSNIMLDERGNAYLSDFGIAQIMQDAGRLTGSGVIGTPAYMSPEQAEGRPLDARADVYALGVVLFEMLTGREPYQADTPMAVLLKQITEPMPSPRQFRPDLPISLESVILRATLKAPAGRYSSASALGEAFTDALQDVRDMRSISSMPNPSLHEVTITPNALPAASTPPVTPVIDYEPIEEATILAHEDRPKPTGEQTQVAASPSRARILALGVAVVALVAVIALAAIVWGPMEAYWDGVRAPTPFAGADTYRGPQNVYQVSIPNAWQRRDASTAERLQVQWTSPDGQAFVTVQIMAYPPGRSFEQWVEEEEDRLYDDEMIFTPIDRASQPDGSIRYSYRVPQPDALAGQFGPGQLDVFFEQEGPLLGIVEVFTADSADLDALLPVLQNVLDSVFLDVESLWIES